MPGTIQVSVLEFKGIASSSPPSSVFIKVSLGKTEYQTWDKGDFSFPLTTLRDSLTVTIQDPEGNEISKIGVHSMTIVEKGIWDNLFPLEGGGHVHMKLQFSLSEEERIRIRDMRESALKKKQREELSKDVRNSKMASDTGDSVASSSPINHEVSGKDAGLPYPDSISRDLQPSKGKEEATLQKHIAPNATDNSEESSSSKMLPRTEVHHMPARKKDTELPHFVVSEAPTLSQENSFISGGTESVVAKIKPVLLRLEDTPVSKQEKQFPPRKPASSIMKMISAFETTLVQENKTPIIEVAAKPQSYRARKEGPLKDQALSHVTKAPELNSERPEYPTDLSSGRLGNKEVSSSGRLLNPPQISSERLGNPSISGKLQQIPPDSMNKGKHIGFPDDIGKIKSSAATRQLLISSTSDVHQAKPLETVTSELNSDHKDMEKQRDKSPEVLRETSLGPRKDKVLPEIKNRGEHVDSAKNLDDNKLSQDAEQIKESSAIKVELAEEDASLKSESESNKDQDHFSTDERSSSSKASTVLKQMKEKGSVKLQPSNVYDWQKGSDKPSFFEGLKEVKAKYSNEFLGTYQKQNTVVSHEDEQHQHESSTAWIFPNDAQRMCVTTGVTAVRDLYDSCQAEGKHAVGSEEMKESESDSLNLRNRKPESWADNAFTGSVKHAIKIAIVVGFGALVLFTRQREPRKSSRKADDPFFRTLPYTDLQTSIEK